MIPYRNLGPGSSPAVLSKYPHMLRKDFSTWSAFLAGGYLDFEEVWYDVHVGRQISLPPGTPEYLYRVAQGVSRKRIDVLARSGTTHFLIEVKPHCNMESLGQVITYRNLFLEEFSGIDILRTVIACRTADADVSAQAEKFNVEIFPMSGVIL